MPIHRTAAEQFKRVQEALAPQVQQSEATHANVESATMEHDMRLLRYRRRVFLVPPVPYRQGLWLLALDQELRRLEKLTATQEAIDRTVRVIFDMVSIFHSLVRPYTRFNRLFWRWLDNPFLRADIGEINTLRHFFCSARTNYSVRAESLIRAPGFLPQTWPVRRPRSPIGILAGWDQTGTLAAGDTT